MAKKVKEIDYLYVSARVHAMENALLNQDRMDRMLSAPNGGEATRVLTECGYPELHPVNVQTVNDMISGERKKLYKTLSAIVPDPSVIDIFKIKYDYHNVKVLIKAEAMGESAKALLMDMGRVPVKQLAEGIAQSDLPHVPGILQAAVREARETLGSTKDPQLMDLVLDRAYFQDMLALAHQTGNRFLSGYVRLLIDVSNLSAIVRVERRKKGHEFLNSVLIPGGEVDKGRIINVLTAKGSFVSLYTVTPLREAAEVGAAASSGSLTRFEKLCDRAVIRYLRAAEYVGIGMAPVISYMGAREAEFTAVRIIVSGLLAGLKPDAIRERLREFYE